MQDFLAEAREKERLAALDEESRLLRAVDRLHPAKESRALLDIYRQLV
jgi:hypothetical protein